jgi:hypothetical protein
MFELVKSSAQFIAINIHNSSKGGSSSLHGNPRPPVNGVVDKRIAQVGVLSVSKIMGSDAPGADTKSAELRGFRACY